jgi:hypothetical protein
VSTPDESLDEIRWHWDSAYNVEHLGGLWLAQRLDKSRATVSARTPDELMEKIRADYAAEPVPRDRPPAPPEGSD